MQDVPIVKFQSVSKHYGNFVAIDNINLQIADSEFITFLGPSGSGKTTTLMLLAGFASATTGGIEMNGQRIEKLPAHKRNIGVVFQNYALFPHMTVRQNLAFPLRARGKRGAEVELAVEESLETIHMGAMAHRKPAELSGGQQQRVALARALIFKPKLVVLDEPLGALDKNLREHLQSELKELHRKSGTTMVFVTHDQSEALTMSDRIVVFNKGKIEQIGTPADLYQRPQTPFVASFIGENNLFPGSIEALSGQEQVVTLKSGGIIRIQTSDQFDKGTDVTICIRPESLSLKSDTTDMNSQIYGSSVLDQIYLGDQMRLILDVDGIGRTVLKTQSVEGGKLTYGDRVDIAIDARRCQILCGN